MSSEVSIELSSHPQSAFEPKESRQSTERQVDENDIPQTGETEGRILEPTDGGPSAWKILISAFIFEAVLWGFSLSYGIFQNYYSHIPEFANSSLIPVVGSTASGIAYLGSPFVVPFVRRFPKYQKHMIWTGWGLCISGLLAASFANSLPGLIITQGVMYGTGFVTFYYPIVSMLNEWWIARRGLAFGILIGSAGASGVVMPFIIEALLNKYGHKTTLRAMAVSGVFLTAPVIPFLKGRLPPAERSATAKANWSFFKKPLFWTYCVSNLAQGLGFFFPALLLPSYAASIGLSPTHGALLLALMSVAQVAGQFTFGFLSDGRVPLNVLVLVSSSMAAAACLALWGLARSLAPLIIFALVYGFFGYAYASMRVRMGTSVTSEPTAALAIFSIFCFGQGVGNVLAGPISGVLLSHITSVGSYGAMKYKGVVIFTGCCMALSALSVGSWYLRPSRIRTRLRAI